MRRKLPPFLVTHCSQQDTEKTLIPSGFVLLSFMSLLYPTGWCLDEDVKPGQEKEVKELPYDPG